MTSLIRSSITGLYHPKRSFDSIDSFSSDTSSSKTTIDRILNADQFGKIESFE